MLWVKSLHLIFMVTWFADYFISPYLFIMQKQQMRPGHARFKIMERKLFYGITTPVAFYYFFGLWLSAMDIRPIYMLYTNQTDFGCYISRISSLFREIIVDFKHNQIKMFLNSNNEVPVLFLVVIGYSCRTQNEIVE